MGSRNFFKIILQSSIVENKLEEPDLKPPKENMHLPKKFLKKHGNELGRKVLFKVPDGKTWEIMVRKTCDGVTWFSQGWSAFAARYSICYAYLLVFKYKGDSCFHVRIYTPNACEIVYPAGDDHRPPNVAVRNEVGEGSGSGFRIETIVATSFKQIRNKATGSEKRTINVAMELSLKNPSWTLVIKPYNFILPVGYVPGKFANAHLGPECSYMIVFDSRGSKEWVIRLNRRERGGLNLGLGWGDFRAENDLKPGDVCLFELVNPGEFFMKSHIFRVSDH